MINPYSRDHQEDESLLLCWLMLLDALVQVALAFCMLFIASIRLASAIVTVMLAVFSFLLWSLAIWFKGFEQVMIQLQQYQSDVRRCR
jgi:small-conductance mechanosensitive channel